MCVCAAVHFIQGHSRELAIYGPMIYKALYLMLLMQVNPITRASGRGMHPRNRDFFGPCEMASSRQAGALAQVMDLAASKAKHYVQGRFNQRSIAGLMYKSCQSDFNRL